MNGNNIDNSYLKQKKKQTKESLQKNLDLIYKKINISTTLGYDYIWYDIQAFYNINKGYLTDLIIDELEKRDFQIRLFEPYLLQILWKL